MMAIAAKMRVAGLGISLALFSFPVFAADGPIHLQVDHLTTPLGLDDTEPRFSWQMQDHVQGAHQSAYEILVATRTELLEPGKADVWESGKRLSGQSVNLRYAGVALKSSTRYFWRVVLWSADGRRKMESESSWWETGLIDQKSWRADWIGYETPEEAAVRTAPSIWIASPDSAALVAERRSEQKISFRQKITLKQAVRHATLYATGQDTVSAWINGSQALTASALPPWKQLPWKKYVAADVTASVQTGTNQLAVELVHYVASPSGASSAAAPAMIATLVVEYADGSVQSFASNADWKSAIHAPTGWEQKSFDDAAWKNAVVWKQAPGRFDGPVGRPWIPDSVKRLRTEFAIDKDLKSARLYATSLGSYELFLNGRPVSDDHFAPGWTDYRQHINYQSYDVTSLLHEGGNAIGALLAPGWYATPLEWFQQPNNYGDTPPTLRAQLRLQYADGQVEWIATDGKWKADTSWILHSEIYDGESQDGRLKNSAWSTAGFAAESWKSAMAVTPKPTTLEAQSYPPIRTEKKLEPKSMNEPKPGVFVYDFGQNFSGVVRLRVEGPEDTVVRLRYAEILNDDGTLYVENLRTAKATDTYILSGRGIEEFTPEFTFHGFRYLEVTGLSVPPAKDRVDGLVYHTDAPMTAHLRTGNEMINQLWNNIQWGQRSNFVGIPSDCPQRDERLGWTADAQVFWRAASYNMDLTAFSHKFAADLRGTQSGTPYYGIYAPGTAMASNSVAAGWSDAGVIIPYTAWLQSGDTSIIDENWTAMEKYLDAIAAANPEGLWKKDAGIPFGDWLAPEGPTDYKLVATAYWAYDATLMRRMALATGRTAAVAKYEKLFAQIRTAFQKAFVHEDGFIAGADNSPPVFGQINNPDAKSRGGDTQTGYVLALKMDLLPETMRTAAVNKLAAKIEANHGLLGTGFLGTPYLLDVLSRNGHAELAYNLLLNTAYPSWGYLVEHGATTMWERWNGDQMKSDPSMNSYNHYAYGAVGDWLARTAAGVDTTSLDAGFHTVVLRPAFDVRLGHVSFNYDSPYGRIHSHWTEHGRTVLWHITLPANTRGWLTLSEEEGARFRLHERTLHESHEITAGNLGIEKGYWLESGSYEFTITLPRTEGQDLSAGK